MTGSSHVFNERGTAVCVGGPLAGRRMSSMYAEYFRVADHEPLVTPARGRTMGGSVTVVTYVKQRFVIGDALGSPILSFWVPEGQTHEQTLELLFACYERHGGDA